MFNKKSASKTNTTNDLRDLAEQATRLEEAGYWGDAAQVWQRIGSHKNASKNTRAEAKGRAAAARVRAEAKPSTESAAVEVVEPTVDVVSPIESATSEAPLVEDAHAAPEAPTGAPMEEVATTPPTPADGAPASEPAANDALAPVAPTATPEEPKAPRPRDARLPEVGTMIQKRDRKGELRCECKVVEGGIEYKGTLYKSLSAAALAASKDLGLGASTLDGWSWWGLKTRPAQPAAKKGKDLGEALVRAFAKYHDRVSAIVKDAAGDDLIKVTNTLKAQAAELVALVEPGESPES